MPLYQYCCPKCNEIIEKFRTMDDRNLTVNHCGVVARRVISVPKTILMKKSGKEMALDSLNSKDTAHMKPEQRQLAYQGTISPPKALF